MKIALALQDGPTVLVAHSWGGTVISETGTDPKVTALVYVAARAPDATTDLGFPVDPDMVSRIQDPTCLEE
jgi:pimeloyl-ACP methyl ester carboxylesterase